jgi:hypothetical protein
MGHIFVQQLDFQSRRRCSQHSVNQFVDELLSVTVGSETLGERVSLLLISSEWGVELDWPQEVVCDLEVWSTGDDLVDEILNAVDTFISEDSSNDTVIGEWNSSSVNLTVTSLVDELLDGLSRWVSVGDEWLDHLEHVSGGFVNLDKDSVMDLSQSEELQDLLWLWGKLVDTINEKLETRQN